jgi:hypothetical protein
MGLEKFKTETQGLQSVEVSDGGARSRVARLQEIGNSVRELSAAVAPMAQRATVNQAQQRGQADALSGNFQPQRNATLAAQEYNRAGFDTALSELEITMRNRIDTIYNEAKHSPAELKTRFDTYRQEIEGQLGGSDKADILPQFRAMYDRATLPHLQASVRADQETTAATNAAQAMNVLETRTNNAERFARTQEIDQQAGVALLQEAQEFEQLLVKHGPKEAFAFNGVQYEADPARSGVFSPVEMEKHSQEWDERMAQAAVLGGFDRAGGLAEKEAYVNAFEKREKGRQGSPFNLDQVDQLANRMRIDINRDRAQSDHFKAELQKQINEAEKVYNEGHIPAGITALTRSAAAYPDLTAQLEILKTNSGAASNFSKMRPDQQAQVLGKFENIEVMTPADIKLKKQMEQIHTETANLLKTDPVSLLPRLRQEVPAVDLSNPATFANRAGTSGMIKSYYGKDHHGLYKSEVEGLSTILHNNTADVNAGYLMNMRAGMDDIRLRSLAQDLAPKNPEFAAFMGIAAERSDIVADGLQGMDVLKLDSGMLPDGATLKSITDDYFGDDVDGIGIHGTNRVMIEQAALAVDAGRRDKLGQKGKENFDETKFKQALEDITGGTFRYKGKKIITPERGMDVDTFKNIVDTLTQDDIKGMSVGMAGATDAGSPAIRIFAPGTQPASQVKIDDFKKQAKLQSIGEGRYLVMLPGGFVRSSDPAHADQFGNYVLDMKAMLPDLKTRNKRVTIMGINLAPDLSQAR